MKNFVLVLVLLTICLTFSINAQNADVAKFTGVKVQNNYIHPQDSPLGTMLYSNGNFITNPTGGAGGAALSALGDSLDTYGLRFNKTLYNWVADDFTVPVNATWTLDSILVYGYQTGSTTTSTFTAASLVILKGETPATATVFAGDTTTNVLGHTYFSGVYRAQATTPTNADRPIMVNSLTTNAVLTAGHYWIMYAVTGSLASGPWANPIVIPGTNTTGNGMQRVSGTWQPAYGATTLFQQGFPFKVYGTSGITPVELTSFTANVSGSDVVLNWATSTEKNNRGFEIQRQVNGTFVSVGFVQGNGTSTEGHSYSFKDSKANIGQNSYRLVQFDFDGSKEILKTVEVDVKAPSVFNLKQNYPNPFNPSTVISFSLPNEAKVTLKVYNTIGQEVSTLINGNLTAGEHNVNFKALNLNSGVYFYQLNAVGIDGKNYSSVNKMVLSK
ncbi:MAG: T9SS type A sorting domain-containing protein [Bacteroidota bacterium]|nr:T9SS type A sorting domain-containing protein [Bacteroidota bacterium]